MNRRFGRRTLAAAGAAAGLLSGVIAMAPSASAATGPTITRGSCSESSFFFQCQISWTGGTDPSTVRWTAQANGSIGGSTTNSAAHVSLGQGNCVPNTSYEVKATVTDANGLSASTFLGGHCDA
jgi:hypothetical protein